MTTSNSYDISEEFIVARQGNGIKLLRPNTAYGPSVSKILQLPFCVYFLNADSIWQKTNDYDVEASGAISEKDVIGKSISHFASIDTATLAINNDKLVMNSNKLSFLEEAIVRKDGFSVKSIGIKFPWYGDNNQVIGLMGFSIIQDKQSLTESLSQITELGILNPAPLVSNLKDLSLSHREKECLRLYVQGHSAKEIGKQLYLSKRTVENYIQNIKSKLGVSTKAQLIYKTVDLF